MSSRSPSSFVSFDHNLQDTEDVDFSEPRAKKQRTDAADDDERSQAFPRTGKKATSGHRDDDEEDRSRTHNLDFNLPKDEDEDDQELSRAPKKGAAKHTPHRDSLDEDDVMMDEEDDRAPPPRKPFGKSQSQTGSLVSSQGPMSFSKSFSSSDFPSGGGGGDGGGGGSAGGKFKSQSQSQSQSFTTKTSRSQNFSEDEKPPCKYVPS